MSQGKAEISRKRIEEDLCKEFPELAPEDVLHIINLFWSPRYGIKKELRGIKTFTVNKLFEFTVSNKKAPALLLHKKLQHRKKMCKYMKKYRKDVMGCIPIAIKKKPNKDQNKYYFIGKFLNKKSYAVKVSRRKYKTFEEAFKKLIQMYKFSHYNFDDRDFNISEENVREKKVFKEERWYYAIYHATLDEDLITYPFGDRHNYTNQIH